MKSESFDLLKVTLVVHLVYTYEVCYNKIPETGKFINKRSLLLTVLGAEKIKD